MLIVATDEVTWMQDLKAYTDLKPAKSLYHGDHWRPLSTYVNSKAQLFKQDGFATLCDFRADAGRRLRDLRSPHELEHLVQSGLFEDNVASVIILRGKPTPQWVSTLGTLFGIPWSFFQRHLALKSDPLEPNLYANPPLPSSCDNIWQMPLFTIVKVKRDDLKNATSSHTEEARKAHAAKLKHHLKEESLSRSESSLSKSEGSQSRIRNSALHDLSTLCGTSSDCLREKLEKRLAR